MEGGEFHLLERLATVICDGLWDEYEPLLVEVAVSKIAPPVPLPIQAARVEVVRDPVKTGSAEPNSIEPGAEGAAHEGRRRRTAPWAAGKLASEAPEERRSARQARLRVARLQYG